MKEKIVKSTFTFEEATPSEKEAILRMEKNKKKLDKELFEMLKKGDYETK